MSRSIHHGSTIFGIIAVTFSMLISLTGTANAALDKGPYLQQVKTDSILVCLQGGLFDNEPVSIRYGTDPNNLSQTVTSNPSNRHEILISGLQPNTRYYYEATYGTEVQPAGDFWTAPTPGTPFKFVALGDNRTDHQAHQKVVDSILDSPYLEDGPRIVVNTGDLINLGLLQSDWDTFFDIEEDLLRIAPLYPAFGNHELGGDALWSQYWVIDTPDPSEKYYAYTYGNIKVMTIDSNDPGNRAQEQFLADEMAAGAADPNVDHLIVNLHHPVYGTSRWGRNPASADVVEPLMNQYKNDGARLVLTGHDHIYQHSLVNDIHYMVIGGGGAPIYAARSFGAPLMTSHEVFHYSVATVDGPNLNFSTYCVPAPGETSFTDPRTAQTFMVHDLMESIDINVGGGGNEWGAEVTANGSTFSAGQQVEWSTRVYNNGMSAMDAWTFHILEIAGQLYFVDYTNLNLVDASVGVLYAQENLPAGYDQTQQLLAIPSPSLGGATLPISWYGAVMNQATGEFGPVSSVTTTHN